MPYFVVVKNNPYGWRQGTFVRAYEDGCEAVVPGVDATGCLGTKNHFGLVLPYREVEWCLMRVQRWGLDAGSVRAERRKREKAFFDQEAEKMELDIKATLDEEWERPQDKVYQFGP